MEMSLTLRPVSPKQRTRVTLFTETGQWELGFQQHDTAGSPPVPPNGYVFFPGRELIAQAGGEVPLALTRSSLAVCHMKGEPENEIRSLESKPSLTIP